MINIHYTLNYNFIMKNQRKASIDIFVLQKLFPVVNAKTESHEGVIFPCFRDVIIVHLKQTQEDESLQDTQRVGGPLHHEGEVVQCRGSVRVDVSRGGVHVTEGDEADTAGYTTHGCYETEDGCHQIQGRSLGIGAVRRPQTADHCQNGKDLNPRRSYGTPHPCPLQMQIPRPFLCGRHSPGDKVLVSVGTFVHTPFIGHIFGYVFRITLSPHPESVGIRIGHGCIRITVLDIVPVVSHNTGQDKSKRNQNHTQDQEQETQLSASHGEPVKGRARDLEICGGEMKQWSRQRPLLIVNNS